MIALIDADLVAYRCAATCKEEDPVDVALFRVDKNMREILEMVDTQEYKAFLTGSNNFRKVVNPEYKANRKDMIPPMYLQQCREYLVTEWNARLSHGQEADDELGINQTSSTIVCSLDKDLLMIPGKHFNWTKQQYGDLTFVSPEGGAKHFWKQMLIGDKADNIHGVAGLGPVKSGKLIDCLESEEECLDVIIEKYEHDYRRVAMNAACLWIKRSEDSEWHKDLDLILPAPLQLEVDTMSESMKHFMDSI